MELFLPHGPLGGRVDAIASKSQLQRLLLCVGDPGSKCTDICFKCLYHFRDLFCITQDLVQLIPHGNDDCLLASGNS